jgi:hypothetical protein
VEKAMTLGERNVGVIGCGALGQDIGKGEMDGYNDANEEPDRRAAESAVQVVAELYRQMKAPR